MFGVLHDLLDRLTAELIHSFAVKYALVAAGTLALGMQISLSDQPPVASKLIISQPVYSRPDILHHPQAQSRNPSRQLETGPRDETGAYLRYLTCPVIHSCCSSSAIAIETCTDNVDQG